MMLYYLDSSAWAKRYFQEAGSEAVDVLFEQIPIISSSVTSPAVRLRAIVEPTSN